MVTIGILMKVRLAAASAKYDDKEQLPDPHISVDTKSPGQFPIAPYSVRSARMGSIRIARRAGKNAAKIAIPTNTTDANENTSGSIALT